MADMFGSLDEEEKGSTLVLISKEGTRLSVDRGAAVKTSELLHSSLAHGLNFDIKN